MLGDVQPDVAGRPRGEKKWLGFAWRSSLIEVPAMAVTAARAHTAATPPTSAPSRAASPCLRSPAADVAAMHTDATSYSLSSKTLMSAYTPRQRPIDAAVAIEEHDAYQPIYTTPRPSTRAHDAEVYICHAPAHALASCYTSASRAVLGSVHVTL